VVSGKKDFVKRCSGRREDSGGSGTSGGLGSALWSTDFKIEFEFLSQIKWDKMQEWCGWTEDRVECVV